MTLEERTALAEREIKETLRRYDRETERICREQEASQGEQYRIDDPRNRPAFKEARKELARCLRAIGEKYNLAPDTKLNL